MTKQQIQALRMTLGESTDEFGERFAVTGRAVEKWEQGTRNPSKFVLQALDRLAAEHPPTKRKK